MKVKIFQHCSRHTDKWPSICERVIKTVRSLLKKSVFLTGDADWLSELPSVIKNNNNTIHSSIKTKPIDASKKSNGKEVSSNLRNSRVKQKPKYDLGQLIRTAEIKRVFSESDSTNWSYKLYTITEVIHDTFPSYRSDFLPERHNENLFKSTNLILDENIKVMKELKLIQ